jgi:nucleoside diphosphate kinase
MSEELSYILATPYTLAKSRTGGVLSRLLSRVDLELIGAQIFTPLRETVESYAESMLKFTNPKKPGSGQLLAKYIINNMMPEERPHRVALFLFRGEDACRKLTDVTGALFPENRSIESITGETIRDTYADLIYSKDDPNNPIYIEPAVLTPPTQEIALYNLKIFYKAIDGIDNVVQNMRYSNPEKIEKTLVIIKPDNWRYPSSRPGTILDMFSRTGLRIIGCKIYQMSVNEGLEFYGAVDETLKEKLGPSMGEKAVEYLQDKFDMKIPETSANIIRKEFGRSFAHEQFTKIVEFMTGRRPEECPLEERDDPGKVKCMIIVYEGEGAIDKIREVLGPTDPTKAPGGTVRREFGHDIMVNTAHASDSKESVEREFKVVKIQKNRCSKLIMGWLDQQTEISSV